MQTSLVTAMAPGVAAQLLEGKFDNSAITGDEVPVYVTTVTASIASATPDDSAVGGCGVSDYVLANPVMAVNAEVPVGEPAFTLTGGWSGATIAFKNEPAINQDGCKLATVRLAYTVS